MKNMKDKLHKACETDEDNERVYWIITDVTSCLCQYNQVEWLTTQFIVGMKALFRGSIVKKWGDLDKGQDNAMKRMNKIVVKQLVVFYSKSWKQRNEVFHDKDDYRKFVID